MSSTNQFPPRHFIPDEGDAKSDHDAAPTPNQASQETSAPLGLPAPPTGDQTPAKGHSKEHSIDVGQPGQRIALDHLGPMVVNKDGTLSRIHNWANMTDSERERTLRLLGKRNQARVADLKGAE